MSQSSKVASSPRQGGGTGLWIVGFLSIGLVVVVLVGLFIGLATSNISVPKAVATLHLIKDVSLPSAAIPPAGHAPIQSLPVDGFDFQAIDRQLAACHGSRTGIGDLPLADKPVKVADGNLEGVGPSASLSP